MSVASALAENYSIFHKALIFFMRLAWRSRITLPYLVMIGFMVLDVRLTLEIIIDVEHEAADDGEAPAVVVEDINDYYEDVNSYYEVNSSDGDVNSSDEDSLNSVS